jgi:F-type H+-transporting ATPase subunit b
VLVDWFTVAAQIVNFLILVGLLKHFLYDRIIRAMDEREQSLHARLEDAQRREDEAEEEARAYRRKAEELEERRRQVLEEAKDKAGKEQKEMLHEARQGIEQLRTKWQQSLEREKSGVLRDIRRLSARHAYEAARRALADLADAELEERIAEHFLKRFKEAGAEVLETIKQAARSDERRVVVRSCFEISSGLRQKITRAFHERLGQEIDVSYDVSEDGPVGVQLKAHGQRIAWDLESYLADLEQEAQAALERMSRREATE